MAAKRYLALVDGFKRLVSGTVQSAGVANAGDIPALDDNGRLDPTLLPPGVGAAVVMATATEALTAGRFVDLYLNAGVLSVRLADASTGRAANGFVLANVAMAAQATVYRSGDNNQLTGLTIGSRYYLSAATPGGIVNVPLDPTDPANEDFIHQFVGEATSATSLAFEYVDPITL
ncbi:hypothetical protein [Nevskia sp.]|uniref:hypothetical protein n=1 Tax=Nevskia sp. TaxID=1929292 RepID=UPI0025EC0627|nr:hypothetical protein [Nevskia sp.]